MNPRTKTKRKKLDRFLVECPMCGNIPNKLIEDHNGYYYFDCADSDCKVGRVMIFTKALRERLQDEGKFQDLFDDSSKKAEKKSLNREKVKGKISEKNIDWTLILYIILAIIGILWVITQ